MDNRQKDKIANEDLMCGVTLGDKHAFETLIHRHQRSVLNFIFRFMGDPTEAEDLTQEVFLRVWKSAGTYQPDAKFTTWVYRIATNLCINKQRTLRIRKWFAIPQSHEPKQKSEDTFINSEGTEITTPEDLLIDSEQSRNLLNVLTDLPTRQRLAIVLKIYDGLSYHEIAQIMDRSVSVRIRFKPYILTFSAPWPKFLSMLENMDESFLATDSWSKVKARFSRVK